MPKSPRPSRNSAGSDPVLRRLDRIIKTLDRIEVREIGNSQALERIETMLKTHATRFEVEARSESMNPGGLGASPLSIRRRASMPNPVPGPVPPGNRVVLTITSKDDAGNDAKIDGELQVLRDDDGPITVTELTSKTSWDIAVDPPTDPTHDTTVSFADSDNMPADTAVIDWNGAVVVPTATGFVTGVRFEPIA